MTHFQCPGCKFESPLSELGKVSEYQVFTSGSSMLFGTSTERKYKVVCKNCKLVYCLGILSGKYLNNIEKEKEEIQPSEKTKRFGEIDVD